MTYFARWKTGFSILISGWALTTIIAAASGLAGFSALVALGWIFDFDIDSFVQPVSIVGMLIVVPPVFLTQILPVMIKLAANDIAES